MVRGGSGEPLASIAAPPISASGNSKSWPHAIADCLEHADRLGGHFGADAVAAEYGDASLHAWRAS